MFMQKSNILNNNNIDFSLILSCFIIVLIKLLKKCYKKEKCERSQLWSMDWCGERSFGHRVSHQTFYNTSRAVLIETTKKKLKINKKSIFIN